MENATLWCAAALFAFALTGCATTGAELETTRLQEELAAHLASSPAQPDAVQVVLAFDAAFDLDLYVTDPLEEAVYFANERSGSGGRLGRDRHCGEEGEGTRIEVVVFHAPLPGRYRVGVDHMRTCRGGRRPGAFAVAFSHAEETTWATGALEPGVFDLIVLEVRVPAPNGEQAGPPPIP